MTTNRKSHLKVAEHYFKLYRSYSISHNLANLGEMFFGTLSTVIAAGHQPAADNILDPFEIFGSMIRLFHGSIVIYDCSAVQSAVCLAAAPVFLLGATRHFVLLSCKTCEDRMLAVFLNGLNGKNRSRRIARNIFSFYFFIQVSRLVIASIFCHTDCFLGNQDCKLQK